MGAFKNSCIIERSTVNATAIVYSVAPTNARTYSPSGKIHLKHPSVSPKEAETHALAMLHYTQGYNKCGCLDSRYTLGQRKYLALAQRWLPTVGQHHFAHRPNWLA